MNDLSFVCLIHLGELTSSLHAVLTLLMGALFFLGYQLVAEAVSKGQITAPESLPAGYWEDYTLPFCQLSRPGWESRVGGRPASPVVRPRRGVSMRPGLPTQVGDTLPVNQPSRGVIDTWTEEDWTEEDRGVLEAFGLLDQANASEWVLDEDPYWGTWTESDRLAIEAIANPEVIPRLEEISDPHPFEGEAAALNNMTLEELIGGVYPAEDEVVEVWDSPGFWARHI
jgi:hypothetical protein